MGISAYIDSSLLFAEPLNENGYTWTLASRLGDILVKAESVFGPRDKNFTILGVELCGSSPQIWFPGNCGNIIIQITESCANDVNRACYQIAHEAVHLLSPIGKADATVLEEGLATYFSAKYCLESQGISWNEELESYKLARLLVEQLLTVDSDIICRIRIKQPKISCITAQDIISANNNIPLDLANKLVSKFER